MTEIEVDSREPLKMKIRALESGDYRFTVRGRQVNIERKTWSDLIQSHREGRLAIQLNQLKANDAIPILLLEGYPHNNELTRKQRRNLLFSIKLTGILVDTSDNPDDTLTRIQEIADYLDTEQHIGMIPYRYSDPKLGALMWVAGIGYVKAKRLLEVYQGDLLSIYMSDKVALSKVLGDRLADRFYCAIRKYPKMSKEKLDEAMQLFD